MPDKNDILSGLIWVQTGFKSYQETALGDKVLMMIKDDTFVCLI